MKISYVFACLPVSNLARTIAWYERLLGRPPDMQPHEREAVWQLADTVSVYVLEDANRAGQSVLTLVVDDLQASLSEIGSRGIEIGPIEEIPGAGWKATMTDPDGNAVAFIQVMAGSEQ
jgi:predicted enzyme related to lactoylglutathione lyase